MSKIVDLKIRLDHLRTTLDDEITDGSSISSIRELHASIKAIEKLLALWEKLPNSSN